MGLSGRKGEAGSTRPPAHSYQLVLRTLMLMRDVSPAYLQHFMTQVDALMWPKRTAP